MFEAMKQNALALESAAAELKEDRAEVIGPELDGGRKFLAGGVLAPNSYFYFAPLCVSQVL